MFAGRCNGGLARMVTFVKEQRQQDPDLLLLNAGDDFIGR
jgi:2',3'-cyclic-nucleotide 2'-phosphodiesterase (5'-nucleotidase family)